MPDVQTEVDDQLWLNEVHRLRLLGMDDATIEARGLLSQPVDVNIDANKLVNVFDYIKHVSGLNVIVNWPCLEAAGVEQDCPVTLSLSNVSISQVLDSVIRQACVVEIEPVVFVVRQGIVNVSTMRDLQRTTESRTYDVRNLISTQGNDDVADSLFLDSAHGITPDEKLTELMTVIVDTVGNQDEWADYGGTVSMVRAYDGRLTITTTPENQYEVAQLLQNRQAGSGGVEAASGDEKHDAVVANDEAGGKQSMMEKGPTKQKKSRAKRSVTEPLIAVYINKNPYAKVEQVATEVGCSNGFVSGSWPWQANRRRLQFAQKQKIDPVALSLEDYLTDAGENQSAQQHRQHERDDTTDALIEERIAATDAKVGRYRQQNPDASEEEMARELDLPIKEVDASIGREDREIKQV